MGCPIRISTDQSLLAAPRGFSQRATSFIASWCQGIHRMPFSRSRSLSPGLTRGPTRLSARHPPCTETILSLPGFDPEAEEVLLIADTLAQHTTVASEHLTIAGCRSIRSDLRWQRPETHQNLIHFAKDLSPGRTRRPAPPFGDTSGITISTRNHPRKSKCRITVASPRYPSNYLHHRSGGGDRIRTDDPLLAKQVLSQLSYTPSCPDTPTWETPNLEHSL